MEFDSDYYNVHCVLRLASGREVTLRKLTQSQTYAGLLEGVPDKKYNDSLINRALDEARRDAAAMGEPYLIEPERRDYDWEPCDMQRFIDRQADLPVKSRLIPEFLPKIQCIGVFRSNSPARDKTQDESSLTIVWFQDDFVIDERAMGRLRKVAWDQYAVDWGYLDL